MPLIENIIGLNGIFVLSILSIILAGILFNEIFIRKKNKKEIFYFLFWDFFILIETIWIYLTILNLRIFFSNFELIFVLLPLIFGTITIFILWKKLNKILSLFILFFTIISIFIGTILIYLPSSLIWIFYFISLQLVNMGFYFLVIKFLIDY